MMKYIEQTPSLLQHAETKMLALSMDTPSMDRPFVQSIETNYKNNFILFVSMGITILCYFGGWIPIFWANDAGAFFTDCLSMW